MSAQPTTPFLQSRRNRRLIFFFSLLVLVVGVAVFMIRFFGNTAETLDTPKSNQPAQLLTERKQVPLDKAARQVAGRFILTAVPRKHLAESYELTHPQLRQGLTKKEWETGNIPVTYYPADELETATFKVDESYPDEAMLEVALLPKAKDVKPQIFYIGLKKTGAGETKSWKVFYWVPRASPAIPNARD